MNFLLHRHFARAEPAADVDADAFAMGAMLPDLFRLVAPRRALLRGANVEALRESGSAEMRALGEGVAHHHRIDRWFHACAEFEAGERDLKERFLATGTRRLLLFAHPGFEMCLDGAWLRRGGDAGQIPRAHRQLVFDAAATAGLPIDAPRLARVFDAYDDGALFDDYASSAGIARRIAGMRMSFGFGAATAQDLAAWTDALAASVIAADAALGDLEASRASFLVRERP